MSFNRPTLDFPFPPVFHFAMSLQETLLEDASARFPHEKAEPLVRELLARVRNGGDGFTGFVNELRAQGLSDTVAGWLQQDTSRVPTLTQTERALGREFVQRVAQLTEISPEATGRQLASLLPKAVAGAAEEEARAFSAGAPSRAVAWVILVALLAAVAGLYWFVAPEAVRGPGRSPATTAPAPLTVPQPVQKEKTATPPVAAKDAPGEEAVAPAKPVEPAAAKETESVPLSPPPAANGQRGNKFAVAALDALKPGASGREIAAALNLSVINFGSNSAVLPKDSVELLKRAAALLKSAPNGTRIEVAGHTDNTGDPAYNVYLSEKRAKAVREELIKDGVKADALVVKGYGGARPVTSNDTRDGRARNRRIEFTVLP